MACLGCTVGDQPWLQTQAIKMNAGYINFKNMLYNLYLRRKELCWVKNNLTNKKKKLKLELKLAQEQQ